MNKIKKETSPDQNLEIPNIDSYLGYWIRFVSNQITNSFQQKFAKQNVTVVEWFILRLLWSHAPCSAARLAEELAIDKGVISRVTHRLEKRHLIKRSINPNDRRHSSIELTASGIKLVPKLAKIADANDQYFFSHLSKSKFNTLMHFFKDMVIRHEIRQKPID